MASRRHFLQSDGERDEAGLYGDAVGERFSSTWIWGPPAELWSYMNAYDREGNDTTGEWCINVLTDEPDTSFPFLWERQQVLPTYTAAMVPPVKILYIWRLCIGQEHIRNYRSPLRSCGTCFGKKQYCWQYCLVQKLSPFLFSSACFSQVTTLKWRSVVNISPHCVLSSSSYLLIGIKKTCWPFAGIVYKTSDFFPTTTYVWLVTVFQDQRHVANLDDLKSSLILENTFSSLVFLETADAWAKNRSGAYSQGDWRIQILNC